MFEKTKRQKKKTKAPENAPHFTNESSVMKHMLLQYTFFFFFNHNSSPCSSKSYNPTSSAPKLLRVPAEAAIFRRLAAVLQLMRVNSQTLLEWLALRHNLKVKTQRCACCDWVTGKKKKERKRLRQSRAGIIRFLSARCVDRNLLNRKPHV